MAHQATWPVYAYRLGRLLVLSNSIRAHMQRDMDFSFQSMKAYWVTHRMVWCCRAMTRRWNWGEDNKIMTSLHTNDASIDNLCRTNTRIRDMTKNLTYHSVYNLRARYPTGQSTVAFHLRHNHMIQAVSCWVEYVCAPGSSVAVAVAPRSCMFRRDGN